MQLPIDSELPGLIELLDTCNRVVLHAPPGAGKTTRVPPALLGAGIAGNRSIVMLEPRRIAARSAARRMARELGETAGQTVGYRIRFEQRVGPTTRIEVVTEGVLLRRLLDDPFLDHVGTVIFDEFHERRLDSDLALAMVLRIQETIRSDLKLVVMSATLDASAIAEQLGNCEIIESVGRQYPVKTEYLRRRERKPLPVLVAEGVRRAVERSDGDVLAFLPGVGEIFSTQRELQSFARTNGIDLMTLFGDQSAEEQDRVLVPASGRKIVLSTNVAESSVTIDGITAVVDGGLARQMQFDSQSGLDRLELVPISKASADQRAGRAGRTAPGVCFRLWEESTHRHRPDWETPEIRRVGLASAVLRLLDWGEQNLMEFCWYEAPSGEQVESALNLLRRLEAADDNGITSLGRSMVRLPVHPRLARLLIEGARFGCVRRAALLAAMLSERDPFRSNRSSDRRPPRDHQVVRTQSDVLERVLALEEYLENRVEQTPLGSIHAGAARSVARIAGQLEALLSAMSLPVENRELPPDEVVMRMIAVAYPDRIAVRREAGSDRALMVGGKGVRLAAGSGVRHARLFACVDVDGRGANATVRLASAVEESWLPASMMTQRSDLFFHPSQKKVCARRRVLYDDLVLDESPAAVEDDEAAAGVLFQAALPQLQQFLQRHDEAAQFVVRVASLREWMPELSLPDFDDASLEQVLLNLCRSCRSFDDLRKADWLTALRQQLDWNQLQTVDSEAPERLKLPGGRMVKLDYQPGRPPVLAARIQELFGCQDTPRVAAGRVRVLLHLLAPNMRPQQVTDDLGSFWSNTYNDVRKELKRRYPKHAWPDDPATAKPAGTRKR